MKIKSEEDIVIEVCKGKDYKDILENGTPQQQYKLADCFANAFMYPKLRKLAIKFYKKAADAGHVEASFRVYINVEDEKKKSALKYLKFAAEKRHVGAKLELARCYIFKNSPVCKTTHQENIGFEIVKELSDKKNESAYYIIASCYETGTGTEIDLEKAKKYYKLTYPRNIDRIDMLIRERDKPNKKTREMIVKKYPNFYKIEDDKLVAL